MKRKNFVCCAAALCAAICIAAPACAAETETVDNAAEELSIPGFLDYKWGDAKDDVLEKEISPDMVSGIDYAEEMSEGMLAVRIKDKGVAGYEADANLLFADDVLIAGSYAIDTTDEEFLKLMEKYSEKYGEPTLEKESTGWGPAFMWIDADGNFIAATDMFGVFYISADSAVIDLLEDQFMEFNEIDLRKEVEKAVSSDGI